MAGRQILQRSRNSSSSNNNNSPNSISSNNNNSIPNSSSSIKTALPTSRPPQSPRPRRTETKSEMKQQRTRFEFELLIKKIVGKSKCVSFKKVPRGRRGVRERAVLHLRGGGRGEVRRVPASGILLKRCAKLKYGLFYVGND